MNYSIKQKDIIQYALCYLIILLGGSVFWATLLRPLNFKAFFVLAIVMMVCLRYGIKCRQSLLMYSFFVLVSYSVLVLIRDGSFSRALDFGEAISMIIYIWLAYFVYRMNEGDAARKMILITVIVAVISLLFFTIQIVFGAEVFPDFLFPKLENGYTNGWLFYTFKKGDFYLNKRNHGIFYEPGVYQVLLSCALYLLLYYKEHICIEDRKRMWYAVIIILAIASAGSTTGYLSTIVILMGVLFQKNKGKNKYFIYVGIAILPALIVYLLLKGTDSFIYTNFIFKFKDFNLSGGNYNVGTSGGARFIVIEMAIDAIKSRPFTGYGSSGYWNYLAGTAWQAGGTGNILGITITNRGVIYTMLVVLPFFIYAFRCKKGWIEWLVIVFMFLNTALGQSQLVYPVFALTFMIISNGWKAPKRNKLENMNVYRKVQHNSSAFA